LGRIEFFYYTVDLAVVSVSLHTN